MQTPQTTLLGLNQWNPSDDLNTLQFTEDNRLIDEALRFPRPLKLKLLWTGNWGSGSIDVTDLSKYSVLFLNTNATDGLCAVVQSHIWWSGAYPSGNRHTTSALEATVSGDRLTWVAGSYMHHNASGNHDGLSALYVRNIYGVYVGD